MYRHMTILPATDDHPFGLIGHGEQDTKLTLDQMQQAVGGLIEMVQLAPQYKPAFDLTDKPFTLLVNEEGTVLGLKPNLIASVLTQRVVYGPMLILTNYELD